jgi:MFS family permease
MYSKEEKSTFIGLSLATAFLRFGKAIVILTFIFYGLTLTDSYLLISIAFGVTGLVQAILTIPFGFLSDYFGRKKIIIIGLTAFIIGSLFCAYPFGNIFILIFGRFLQGAGAIYACVLAFIGDVIPDNKRSQTLAYFSIITGIVFSVGIILGPTLSPEYIQYEHLFLLAAVLVFILLIYIILFIPEPKKKIQTKLKRQDLTLIKQVLGERNLVRIYLMTFFINFILVSILLLLLPIILEDYIPSKYSGLLLLPIFIFGMFIMVFTSKIADKGKRITVGSIAILLIGTGVAIFFIPNLYMILIGLIIFFTGMAIVDPILPSLIIKVANKKIKGTASGFYDASRYLGESVGGFVAGIILIFNISYLLVILITLAVLSIIILMEFKSEEKS